MDQKAIGARLFGPLATGLHERRWVIVNSMTMPVVIHPWIAESAVAVGAMAAFMGYHPADVVQHFALFVSIAANPAVAREFGFEVPRQ